MKKPICEDVTPLRVAGELYFVDGEKVDVDVAGHGFYGCHPVTCAFGFDLLFTGDKGDFVSADAVCNLVVDLACEQTQRQADHAAVVAKHSLDRKMRLSGIRRTQNRRYIADAGFKIHGRAASIAIWLLALHPDNPSSSLILARWLKTLQDALSMCLPSTWL